MKPKANSGHWAYFSPILPNKIAICLFDRVNGKTGDICKAQVSIKSSSPKSMIAHLKSKHGYCQESPAKISKFSNHSILKFANVKKLNDISSVEADIARLICEHNIPISKLVNCGILRNLFETKYGRDIIPKSYGGIKSIILKFSDECKELVKNEMVKSSSSFSILFDEWTSRANQQYISIVAKSVDSTFNLGLVHIKTKASAENLLMMIMARVSFFGINNVKYVTCDGASVNKKLSRVGNLKIQQCVNHGLHLAVIDVLYNNHLNVQQGVDELSENDDIEDSDNSESDSSDNVLTKSLHSIISSIRKISVKFKRSPKLMNILRQFTPLKPIIDCKTRWNSMLLMIKRFMEIKNSIKHVFINENIVMPLNDYDENQISILIQCLERVNLAITKLSSNQSNLVSADLTISELLTSLQSQNTLLSNDLRERIAQRYVVRRTIMTDILIFLCRNGLELSKFTFYIEPSKENIHEFLCSVHGKPDYSENYTTVTTNSNLSDLSSLIIPKSHDKSFDDEFERFKTSGILGKNLQLLFDNIKSVSPTSTENERVFSTSGQFVSPFRSKLSPDLLDAFVFLNKFFKL